jgi:hypothetical protein
MKNILSGLGGLAVAAALLFGGWTRIHASEPATPGYHAVLLDNNQVYFGKLSGLGSGYPLLTDVYYVQSVMNPETKQSSNILLKRGKEWHAPDKMYLSASHILMVEPVTQGSTVAKLIEQSKSQK